MAIADVTLVHYAIAIAYIYIILIYFIKATFINNSDCSCSACTLRNRHRLHLCYFTVAFFIRPANYFNLLSEPIMFFISSTHVSYMFLRAVAK